jgi:ABC-type transport system involved in multi-copper enzyme maturation permease subunit
MTTATRVPARPRPARAATAAPVSAARLLRIELRRNPMPWILPLIAVLFWFDSYRPSTSQPPLWALRAFWNMGQGHTIVDFGPLVAGVAAWIGSRDGRRGTVDLVTATARPRWAGQLAAWAATAVWAVGAYLVFVGVLFGVYLAQGVQGTPPWWWAAVGAAAVTAFSAAGFAVGAFFPSRFAAPVAAFGATLAMMLSSQTGFSSQTGWAQVLPTNSNGNFEAVSGVFYRWLPDLPIARVMFLAGLALVALGLLGLPARAGGLGLRRAAAVVTLAGLAASGTAAGLAATARLSPQGLAIPALHDAANNRPIRYTPVCGPAGGTPVCLHPAYRRYLPAVTAALRPVFAEVAGLSGAPVRARQVPGTYNGTEGEANQPMTIGGRPPVLGVPLDTLNLLGSGGFTARPVSPAQFAGQLRVMFVHAFVGAGAGAGTPAQQAVQAAMLANAGVPFAAQPQLEDAVATGPWPPPGGAVGAAARRLAAQPASARHAWLAAHLPALRSGRLSLAGLP